MNLIIFMGKTTFIDNNLQNKLVFPHPKGPVCKERLRGAARHSWHDFDKFPHAPRQNSFGLEHTFFSFSLRGRARKYECWQPRRLGKRRL
jgi:hypothetical protein